MQSAMTNAVSFFMINTSSFFICNYSKPLSSLRPPSRNPLNYVGDIIGGIARQALGDEDRLDQLQGF
jgi:hypothetical protein